MREFSSPGQGQERQLQFVLSLTVSPEEMVVTTCRYG